MHPHLRDLVRFEEARLGTTIAWPTADGERTSPSSVTIDPPPADASRTQTACLLPDGTAASLPLAALPGNDALHVEGLAGPVAIASVNGSAIQMAVDVEAVARAGQRALLVHLWDSAIVPALERAAAHAREAVDRLQLEAYLRFEENWHRTALARLPAEIDSNDYNATRLENQLRELVTKNEDLRRQERAMRSVSTEALLENARAQLVSVRRLVPATYRSIDLQGSQLIGRTHAILIDDGETEVDVGEFDVAIDLEHGEVSIRNVTRAVDGVQHPHVRTPTEPCFGNLKPGIVRLLAAREWSGVLTVVHRFLGSVNSRDTYLALSHWGENDTESDDEEHYDDENDESIECGLCGESVASDEVTDIEGSTPCCLSCYDSRTLACADCSARIVRNGGVASGARCRCCASAPRTMPPVEVAS